MIYCLRNVIFALWASYGVPSGRIKYEKINAAEAAFIFYHNIFEENISQAKPISHAARRISQIGTANLYHCGLGISLCSTH